VRIVVLTYGGDDAERILLRLSARGVLVDGLVIVDPPSAQARLRRARTLRLPPRALVAGALRRTLARVERPRRWSGLAREVVHAGPLNGTRTLGSLRALAPDYLVLAHVGMSDRVGDPDGRRPDDEIVAIPSVGTFNAHRGLLPWARGSGVIQRSIERRIAVGVTVHLVDAGVHTGPILQRRLVPIVEADTLETLGWKAAELCTELMVETVSAFSPENRLASEVQHELFPVCTWPARDEERRIELDVAAGVPLRLYEKWRAAAGGDVLPADFVAPKYDK
jgi:methionyl-tRNA formyltransferase